MALKHSTTTADYLHWDTATSLVRKLYKEKKYRLSLLLGCGFFFGLRISDLKKLTWAMLMDGETFILEEKKTGKKRIIKINAQFREHISDCYSALGIIDRNEPCFLSRKKTVYSTQRINTLFKEVKTQYKLKIEHFSTHSCRKTFGRRVVEQAGEQAEMALIRLSEIFNHSSVQITKRYLGIRQEELQECYDMLEF
ncbi:MAG: tyrosine-type recombinase/integrase [Prevotellaceae bacterium]|nr:tyrosine-type recombinase/integrase [Candidatus Colivivens equi]